MSLSTSVTGALGPEVYAARRSSLLRRLAAAGDPLAVLLFAGVAPSRNAQDLHYPFRCSSHILYFAGPLPAGSLLLLTRNDCVILLPPLTKDDLLWHGEPISPAAVQRACGVEAVYYLSHGRRILGELRAIATLTPSDAASRIHQQQILADLEILDSPRLLPDNRKLIEAIVEERLLHDEAGRAELRAAAADTCAAFAAARDQLAGFESERAVADFLRYHAAQRHGEVAFAPIVTQQPEVLHAAVTSRPLRQRPLLLVDFGVERASGYCADVTRTYVQEAGGAAVAARELVQMVQQVQESCVRRAVEGVRFLALQQHAEQGILQGLRELGVLRGSLEALSASGIISAFFPHGVGHAIGIDVHDMHDFGDVVGYPDGRTRATGFGRCFLRFDRDLIEHMAITIEPGCYFSPALLTPLRADATLRRYLDEQLLETFLAIGGVRIEDTILITANGAENLTGALPK